MIYHSEMTPLDVINLGPETMEEVNEFANFFSEGQDKGIIDSMDVYLKCTAFQKALEIIKSGLQKAATEEASKYGKHFEKKGFEIKLGEVGAKWHFDQVNDPVLIMKESFQEQAKTAVEDRKKFLKSLKEPLRIVDEETGESYVLNPPYKTSSTSLIVTVK